eukprot:7258764-Prymnesium_polylepis.1
MQQLTKAVDVELHRRGRRRFASSPGARRAARQNNHHGAPTKMISRPDQNRQGACAIAMGGRQGSSTQHRPRPSGASRS